jgi:heterodisulfide reductase subunit B2
MKYLYYPGCSLKSTGRPYEESLLAVFKALDVELEELNDWNCCGATAYMSIDEKKAFGLAARNLALAEQQHGKSNGHGVDLLAPCSACFLVLTKSQKYFAMYDEVRKETAGALEAAKLDYRGTVKVRHPLDVLLNDIGVEKIAKHTKVSLKGMKVACYYGCQVVRPFATFDDAFYPTSMDRIIQATGAQSVEWPLKTRCCGGSLMGTITEAGLRLSQHLLDDAVRRKADVMVTCCPLCQLNLECYQDAINKRYGDNVHMPVMYFTQLLGMAFGISERDLGIQRLFVKPKPLPEQVKKGVPAHV